jgi:polyhydroxyalkanoate synthase
VWNYVVGNYLKGETPPPFDLLYWNSDSHQPCRVDVRSGTCATPITRIQMVQPGALTVCGEKLDLTKVDTPAYVYASREDHIVPWMAAREHEVMKGKGRFVSVPRATSPRHQPPAAKKRSHWSAARRPPERQPGSTRPASTRAAGGPIGDWLKAIAAADCRAQDARNRRQAHRARPGRYVKQKA